MTLAVFALMAVAPWLAIGSHSPVNNGVLPSACGLGSSVLARLGRDSPVVKIGLNETGELWPVVTPRSAFRAGLHPLTYQFAELDALAAGTAIVFLHDLTRSPGAGAGAGGRMGILVGDGGLIPSDGRLYRVCVADDAEAALPGARQIVSVHPVESKKRVSQ